MSSMSLSYGNLDGLGGKVLRLPPLSVAFSSFCKADGVSKIDVSRCFSH